MLSQLRQNLFLKIISLIAAITIYVYVQGERHPTVTRMLLATVTTANVASGLEVEPAQDQVEVVVSGPRTLVDRLKDSDVRAVADLRDIQPTEPKTALVRINLTPNLPPDMVHALVFDSPTKTMRIQVFPQQSRLISVKPLYPKDPPAGYRYGTPEVSPFRVKIIGRADRVSRVDRVIANAVPTESGAAIDGDYTVVARDKADKPVDDLTFEPDTVHVTIPLVEEPSTKIVFVSPTITEPPLPPYKIAEVTATPAQIKISGRPGRLAQIFTLATESIPTRDLTENQTFETALVVPQDVTVHDMDGHPITYVSVKVRVKRDAASTPPNAAGATTAPPTP